MARKVAKRPHVSVLLAVRDGVDAMVRSVESVLNQRCGDFQLIIAACASCPSVISRANRYAEHEIRVDVLELPEPDLGRGRDAALAVARGTHVLLMDEGDWLSPTYLNDMIAAADATDAELVVSSLSLESPRADGGRASVSVRPASRAWSDAVSLRQGIAPLLVEHGVASVTGKLVSRALLQRADARFAGADPFDLALAVLDAAERASIAQAPCYHAALGRGGAHAAFDPELFSRCERHHARLLGQLARWGAADLETLRAAHNLHLTEVIRCIENASLAPGRLSTIERRHRVQDMIDAPSTRASIEALRSSSRDFGLMFAPIARRSAAACCMGARIQDIVARALAPVAHPRLACI